MAIIDDSADANVVHFNHTMHKYKFKLLIFWIRPL